MNSVRHYKRIFPIVCKHCHSYFTSAVAVSRHGKGCLFLFGIPVSKPTVFINEEDDDSDAEIGEKDVDDDFAGHNHRRLSQQARSSKLMSRKKVTKMNNYWTLFAYLVALFIVCFNIKVLLKRLNLRNTLSSLISHTLENSWNRLTGGWTENSKKTWRHGEGGLLYLNENVTIAWQGGRGV